MPSDDYASVVRGGLKLKGAAKPAGITKKKKKKKEGKETESQNLAIQKALEDEDAASSSKNERGEPGEMSEEALRELEERGGDGKTATERAHEEMRRKRLEDRLKREGVKTHKERVEELNKYLSNLSEHHDMPRIGPG